MDGAEIGLEFTREDASHEQAFRSKYTEETVNCGSVFSSRSLPLTQDTEVRSVECEKQIFTGQLGSGWENHVSLRNIWSAQHLEHRLVVLSEDE